MSYFGGIWSSRKFNRFLSNEFTVVGAVRQKKWQNSAKWDKGLKIGENIPLTIRKDLRNGAKKNLQWTYEILHIFCKTFILSIFDNFY